MVRIDTSPEFCRFDLSVPGSFGFALGGHCLRLVRNRGEIQAKESKAWGHGDQIR